MAWLTAIRRAVCLATIASLGVWVIHHPGDSTDVAAGQTLGWFCVVLVAMGCVLASLVWAGWSGERMEQEFASEFHWRRWWFHPLALDALLLMLAGVMTCSVFANWGEHGRVTQGDKIIGGDQRAALNSLWFWWVGSAWVITLRCFLRQCPLTLWPVVASQLVRVVMVVGVFLTVLTLHQDKISLPQTRAIYEADPDGELLRLGLDAPADSAARMVFENRLYDGGPTATFALANTLAGWLAITAVLVGGSLWESKHWPMRLGLLAVTAMSLLAIRATDSRAAMLALVCTGVTVFAWNRIPRLRQWLSTQAGASTVMAVLLCPLALGILLLRGNRNWRQDVPASLGFRLDYWASTLKMVADRPWLGIAPGNFKTAYPGYRSDWAHEEIADPHHFWFETLALGGWHAGILLLVILIVFLLQIVRGASKASDEGASEREADSGAVAISKALLPRSAQASGWALAVGALVGWALVWWDGIRSSAIPDFEATQLAFPAAIAFAIGLWRWPMAWNRERLVQMSLACLGCLGVHLSFSGGMTVPGLAWAAWTFVAIASTAWSSGHDDALIPSRVPDGPHGKGRFPWRFISLGLATFFIVMGVVAYRWVVTPVRDRETAMAEAQTLAQGRMTSTRMRLVVEQLDQAERADPLAWEPASWRAALWSQFSVASNVTADTKDRELERHWRDALKKAREQALGNPGALARLFEQPLRRYELVGDPSDLDLASEILAEAIAMHPTQQAWIAQMALLVQERERAGVPMSDSLLQRLVTAIPGSEPHLGQMDWSRRLARRAVELGDSGGVLTRQLWLHWLIPIGELEPDAASQRLRADLAMAAILDEG
ncbi:MAG: O-antigen ligase family protein [Planctomycetota bacterium]